MVILHVAGALAASLTFALGAAGAATAADTPVNSQITDAVTQTNVKTLGDAPAMAIGSLYTALSHSTGLTGGTVPTQQVLQVAQAQGVAQIYSIDTRSDLTSLVTGVRSASDSGDDERAAARIARMAERLEQCGDDCIVNLHIHVDPRRAQAAPDPVRCSTVDGRLPDDVATQPAVATATCVAAEMGEVLGTPVSGVALVVPDASVGGDTAAPPVTEAPGTVADWFRSPVTSIDIYVQG